MVVTRSKSQVAGMLARRRQDLTGKIRVGLPLPYRLPGTNSVFFKSTSQQHMISAVHHIAIICSDYQRSKTFYVETLGLKILKENYRAERNSYKLDLAIDDHYVIELFSFPDPPRRVSGPEACGLRHLAFAVKDIGECVARLSSDGVACEPLRVDPFTGKRFTFFSDPDGLPLELYEDVD